MSRAAELSYDAGTVVAMHRRMEPALVSGPSRRVAVAVEARLDPASGSTTQAVLKLHGSGLDDRLDDVQRQVDALLEAGPRILVVDVSEAVDPSSSTIAALMCVRRRASARGVEVVLRAADRRLVDTLQRSGLLAGLTLNPLANEPGVEPAGFAYALTASQAGVTRLDLVCGPQVVHSAQELTGRWAQDRALSADARTRLASLVVAAVAHGLRFDPRSVTITIRWLDPDRVRVDVRWKGCSDTARPSTASGDLESTAGTLDAFAEDWGFGTSRRGPVHWMVFDTR